MSKDLDLEEIRRRQRELVEMKKVQQGQVEAPHVDLEAEKIVPKTAKEKRKNFWYHYKWATIITVVAVIFVTYLMVDLFTKPKYDLTVIGMSTYQFAIDKEAQAKSFQPFATDYDGNGEVSVTVDAIDMYDTTNTYATYNPQLVQASSVKMVGALQTFEGFIFVLDQYTYDRIITNSDGSKAEDVFLDLSQYTASNSAFQGDKLYLKGTKLAESWGLKEVPDDLFLCLRDYTTYEKQKEKIQKQYEYEKSVFEKLIQSVLAEPAQTDSSSAAADGSSN